MATTIGQTALGATWKMDYFVNIARYSMSLNTEHSFLISFIVVDKGCNNHDVSIITPNSNPQRGYICHTSLYKNPYGSYDTARVIKDDDTGEEIHYREYYNTDLTELTGQFVHGAPIGELNCTVNMALCSRNFQNVKLRLDFVEI